MASKRAGQPLERKRQLSPIYQPSINAHVLVTSTDMEMVLYLNERRFRDRYNMHRLTAWYPYPAPYSYLRNVFESQPNIIISNCMRNPSFDGMNEIIDDWNKTVINPMFQRCKSNPNINPAKLRVAQELRQTLTRLT